MQAALAGVSSELVLQIVEAAAVVASAIAGMIIASNKRMDLVGTFALACVNAFGGGTLRDLLLDNRPFYWMANWWFLVAILVTRAKRTIALLHAPIEVMHVRRGPGAPERFRHHPLQLLDRCEHR